RGGENLVPGVFLGDQVVEVLALLIGLRLILRALRDDGDHIIAIGKDARQTRENPLDGLVHGAIDDLRAAIRSRRDVAADVVVNRQGALIGEIAPGLRAVSGLRGLEDRVEEIAILLGLILEAVAVSQARTPQSPVSSCDPRSTCALRLP